MRGWLQGAASVVGTVVLVIVVGAAGVAAVGAVGVFSIGALVERLNPFGTTTTDRSGPALLASIRDVSEYRAAVGDFQVVLDVERDVRFVPDFFAGERTLFIAAGTVDGYVDLSGLAEGDLDVSEDRESVRITLPEAQVGEANLDQDRTYLYSQERGVYERASGLFGSEDQSEFYQLAEERLAAAAADSDLRQRAQDNTRTMLTGMFQALDMTVTFVDG